MEMKVSSIPLKPEEENHTCLMNLALWKLWGISNRSCDIPILTASASSDYVTVGLRHFLQHLWPCHSFASNPPDYQLFSANSIKYPFKNEYLQREM